MKKSVLESVIKYLQTNTGDRDALLTTLTEELNHLNSKAMENAAIYNRAIQPVLDVMSETPMTAKDIYNACADNLPEGFTANKVQYLLLHQLADRVKKQDNGKNPNTYSL